MTSFSKNKPKFHIIHNYTAQNTGWAAVVISTTQTLRKIFPNVKFTIESYHPKLDSEVYHEYGIEVVERITSSPKKSIINLFLGFIWYILSSIHSPKSESYPKQLRTYLDSDIMLDLGGDNLSIPSGKKSIVFSFRRNILTIIGHSYVFLLCIFLRKPMVIYAQTIGPLGIMRGWVKILLNKMSLITVRETKSLNYLHDIGVDKSILHYTADPAFLLPSTSGKELEQEGINTTLPVVGICPSSESAKFHFKKGESEFKSLFAEFIDAIVDKYETYVLLIPFSTWQGHGGDDRVISNDIFQLVKHKQRVGIIRGRYNPVQLKGIISRCSFFLGSRGHSVILALSACVPTVAIGHNPKYYGIMKMFDQENLVCKTENLTYEELVQKFDNMWLNGSNINKKLKDKITDIQKLAMLNGKLVKSLYLRIYQKSI